MNKISKFFKKTLFFRRLLVLVTDTFNLKKTVWERFSNNLQTCYPCCQRIYTKKQAHKLYRDFLNFWIKYDYNMTDYFSYEFIRLNTRERKTYISDSYRFVLDSKVNSKEYKNLFEDKAQFDEKFSAYMQREILVVNGSNDKNTFEKFCQKHKKICIKPRNAHRGMGVEILDVSTEKSINEAWKKVSNNKMIVEETIKQHSVLAAPHPQSINTLRISTAIDKNGTPHIMACCFRMGLNNNYTDNFSGGGCVAPIDIKTGVITNLARDLNAKYYTYHPTTGHLLVGIQIPEWEVLKKLALEVASIVPEMRYIGWDWTLDQNGNWELIEGNNPGGVHTLQLTAGKGLKEEYDKILLDL